MDLAHVAAPLVLQARAVGLTVMAIDMPWWSGTVQMLWNSQGMQVNIYHWAVGGWSVVALGWLLSLARVDCA